MDLSNIYSIIGTSCAGKSTAMKHLAKQHNDIALEGGRDLINADLLRRVCSIGNSQRKLKQADP